jgi:hypothetical protein
MKKDYIREIGLATLVKSVKVNFKLILLVLIPFMIVIVALIILAHQRQVSKFTTTGVIQINNINPLTYSDLPSLDQGSSNSNGAINTSGLSTNSETIVSLLTTDYILSNIIIENNFDIDMQPLKSDGLLGNLTAIFSSFPPPIYPKISKLEVSHRYYNHKLKLVFTSVREYVLYDNFTKLGNGMVGKQLITKDITLLVDSYSGNPKQKFILIKFSIDAVVSNLIKQLKIDPVIVIKKSTQSDTGIINISITGVNPVRQAILINDIIEEVRTKSWERQRQNLKQSIEFIENQTQLAKKNMTAAQESLVAFQAAHNIINLDDQAKNDLLTMTDLDLKALDKQITLDQFKSLYTANHPLIIALKSQLAKLTKKRDAMHADFITLPLNQARFASLKNNFDVNQQLYLLLLNKGQNLKIKYAGTNSPVEVLTYATSDVAPILKPLSAKLIASTLSGVLLLEIFFVLWFTIWMTGDPYLLPHLVGSKLLAIIPYLRDKHKCIDYSHPGFNLINAYFLRKLAESKNASVCCNFSSINLGSGKTFIIDAITNYFTKRDKRVLQICFGTTYEFMSVRDVYQHLDEELGFSDLSIKKVKLEINIGNSMDINGFKQLLSRTNNFDFVFIESWAILDSQVFMNISKLVNENIIISEPRDTPGLVKLMADGFSNLDIKISRIIYNHPKKPLLNSVYSINKVD